MPSPHAPRSRLLACAAAAQPGALRCVRGLVRRPGFHRAAAPAGCSAPAQPRAADAARRACGPRPAACRRGISADSVAALPGSWRVPLAVLEARCARAARRVGGRSGARRALRGAGGRAAAGRVAADCAACRRPAGDGAAGAAARRRPCGACRHAAGCRFRLAPAAAATAGLSSARSLPPMLPRTGWPGMDDPSNSQLRFDRNYLRARSAAARCASAGRRWQDRRRAARGHCAVAAAWLAQSARRDLAAAADGAGPGDRRAAPLAARAARGGAARWIAERGLRVPEERHLRADR